MPEYLEFKKANCRDCYKCLRECPVKAIKFVDEQAQLIEDRCILCGECTLVCHQNAKRVHSEMLRVQSMLKRGEVIASVAPSFVTSLKTKDFGVMHAALKLLGFADAEETAVGANVVIQRYTELLESGRYKNLISSCCTSVNLLIRQYFPDALKYLAPVDTPMVAHAKLIKQRRPEAKVVFIGPCLSKKWEADNSGGAVDGVLTFEDLDVMLRERQLTLDPSLRDPAFEEKYFRNRAKYFPIDRGVIKSFKGHPGGFEFIGVSGTRKVMSALKNIDNLSGVFLEVNACEYGCINGPCSIREQHNEIGAIADVRAYVGESLENGEELSVACDLPLRTDQPPIVTRSRTPSEREIDEVLRKIGKFEPCDELNCSSCGYSTCREKAWAVLNGYAELEMCLPYMRERAESMSNEIIKNSPNGIVLVNSDLKILELNDRARELLGITDMAAKGSDAFEYMDASDFIRAQNEGCDIDKKEVTLVKTGKTVELSVTLLKEHKLMFAIMTDITQKVDFDRRLSAVKLETLATTDEVIKKQMRVAQEIASLLGETTAETKVALLKLKKTLQTHAPEDK